MIKNVENTDDGFVQTGADHEHGVLEPEKQEVFITENYVRPKDPNDDKMMTQDEYKKIYEPNEIKTPDVEKEASPSKKVEDDVHHKNKPERELTRWELMRKNRKSKTKIFGEAMMKRSG